MGFVSYSEDIEELRLHHKQITEKVGKTINSVQYVEISDPNTTDRQVQRLIKRIVSNLTDLQSQIDDTFSNAEKILRDPNIAIVKRLEKKTESDKRTKSQLARNKGFLEECRKKNVDLQRRIEELEKEVTRLRGTVEWVDEIQNVRPLQQK